MQGREGAVPFTEAIKLDVAVLEVGERPDAPAVIFPIIAGCNQPAELGSICATAFIGSKSCAGGRGTAQSIAPCVVAVPPAVGCRIDVEAAGKEGREKSGASPINLDAPTACQMLIVIVSPQVSGRSRITTTHADGEIGSHPIVKTKRETACGDVVAVGVKIPVHVNELTIAGDENAKSIVARWLHDG